MEKIPCRGLLFTVCQKIVEYVLKKKSTEMPVDPVNDYKGRGDVLKD